ncbi:MAG: hypothetical protein QXU32_05740 [Nitrososphaerales archaeon]
MLGIRLETGMALAALALHVMFVLYLSSFYYALTRPIIGENIILYPTQLLLVGIFLFGLPGFGLSAIAYLLAKRDAPKVVSVILIAQGIVVPVGIFYASTLVNIINEEYRTFEILIVPQIFIVPGFVPIGFGIHIAKLKPVKRRYT